jgi:UDP-GlcNAc:undecaprenyl-phosphate/decaprenyl-phosphate GlcNAc-1-phosphate transferase
VTLTLSGMAALPLALLGFAAAFLVAFAVTPLASRVAALTGAIDRPGAARRVHARPVPRAGGLAIAIAFVVVGIAVLWYNASTGVVSTAFRLPADGLATLFIGSIVAAALGFLDDRFELRARWQLLAQLGLAAFVVIAGVTIDFVNNPFGSGLIRFTGIFAAAFTALWVVGMINSINFIDGLDGLSCGVSMIAAITLGGISLTAAQNQPIVAVLCFVLAGSLAGFLPWNFHPARAFVGTTGVFLLGYALAVLSILGTAKVAVALLVLGVPIIDTFWIIVRRLAQGHSPFTPDRGHLHHRLLDLGLSHREAVLVIYAICALLAVLSFVLSGTGQLYAFLGTVVTGGVLLYFLTMRSREALQASSYEEQAPGSDVAGEAEGDTGAGEPCSR